MTVSKRSFKFGMCHLKVLSDCSHCQSQYYADCVVACLFTSRLVKCWDHTVCALLLSFFLYSGSWLQSFLSIFGFENVDLDLKFGSI